MTFERISSDTSCDCLAKTEIDTSNEYVRKLRKDKVEERDFLTHWEREIRPESQECEDICSYKGVSINQFKNEYESQILNKYKTTFKFNPKKGAYYLKFKFNENVGRIKYAPEDDDISHYNFFKADEFQIENLLILETVKFA